MEYEEIKNNLNKIIEIQNQNNILLKEIYKIISNNSNAKEFGINVAANLLVELLKNNN